MCCARQVSFQGSESSVEKLYLKLGCDCLHALGPCLPDLYSSLAMQDSAGSVRVEERVHAEIQITQWPRHQHFVFLTPHVLVDRGSTNRCSPRAPGRKGTHHMGFLGEHALAETHLSMFRAQCCMPHGLRAWACLLRHICPGSRHQSAYPIGFSGQHSLAGVQVQQGAQQVHSLGHQLGLLQVRSQLVGPPWLHVVDAAQQLPA